MPYFGGMKLFNTLSLVAVLTLFGTNYASAQKPDAVFSKATIDIGITVADVKKSATFYSEVLGLTEVKGFEVSAEKAANLGLTDNQPVSVRVFVLNDEEGATTARIKLMAFPSAPGVKPDQKFIHSTIAISYLLIPRSGAWSSFKHKKDVIYRRCHAHTRGEAFPAGKFSPNEYERTWSDQPGAHDLGRGTAPPNPGYRQQSYLRIIKAISWQ